MGCFCRKEKIHTHKPVLLSYGCWQGRDVLLFYIRDAFVCWGLTHSTCCQNPPFLPTYLPLSLYYLSNSWSVFFLRSGQSWILIIFKCGGEDLKIFKNENHVKYVGVGDSQLSLKMVIHFEVDGIPQSKHSNQKLQSYHEWNCYISTTSYHLIPELDIMTELEHSDKNTLHHALLQMLWGYWVCHWGDASFDLAHTILVDRASFFPSFNPDRLSFWRDDWRSVGALIPWSGSRCHSKGTRPVWSAVERLSGHGTLWFSGQEGNRLYCPKVPMLLLSDNKGEGLAAIEQTIAITVWGWTVCCHYSLAHV